MSSRRCPTASALGWPRGGVEGFQLSVQVGQGHGIVVHDGQLSDAGAGQALGSVAAYAAQAEEITWAADSQPARRDSKAFHCAEKDVPQWHLQNGR